MNEMYQVCEAINGDWDKALEGFITDGRIGNSHIDVPGHDGDFGFGGKCFPKDLNAMIKKFGLSEDDYVFTIIGSLSNTIARPIVSLFMQN